jgi:hypothetical protein
MPKLDINGIEVNFPFEPYGNYIHFCFGFQKNNGTGENLIPVHPLSHV